MGLSRFFGPEQLSLVEAGGYNASSSVPDLNPEYLGLSSSEIKENWMDPVRPYLLPTMDLPDIVFSYGKGFYLAAEIETTNAEPGAYQCIKYRSLICAQRELKLDDPSVSAALVAFKIDSRVKSICDRYRIARRTKRL